MDNAYNYTLKDMGAAVNSWDLFDTLVAAQDVTVPCGDQPESKQFPILEHVLKVGQNDIIISDYYDSDKALRIVRNILRLNNRLYVGSHIKAQGTIWNFVTVDHHTGDHYTEVLTAKRAGLAATLVHLSRFTPVEKELYDSGFRGLASSMREARLVSFHPMLRDLQLLQNQANFPFLFLASILLHRKVTAEGFNRVLMSSRDAFLWKGLQDKIRFLHHSSSYDIYYFYTSRLTRYSPSVHILHYTEQILTDKTLIVDLCGRGHSLSRFAARLSLVPSLWLLVGYADPKHKLFPKIPHALDWVGTTVIELANLATHPMISDVSQDTEGVHLPIYLNPTGVNWAQVPEINVMHEAYNLTLSVMSHYDFTTDLQVDDHTLMGALNRFYRRVENTGALLAAITGSFFSAEEASIRKILTTHDL
jgi:hypothetical protein